MTGIDHESASAVDHAAHWLAGLAEYQLPTDPIAVVRSRFGLTMAQAIEAIAQSKLERNERMVTLNLIQQLSKVERILENRGITPNMADIDALPIFNPLTLRGCAVAIRIALDHLREKEAQQ